MSRPNCWIKEFKDFIDSLTDDKLPTKPEHQEEVPGIEDQELMPVGKMSKSHLRLYCLLVSQVDAFSTKGDSLQARADNGDEISIEEAAAFKLMQTKVRTAGKLMWNTVIRDFGIPEGVQTMTIGEGFEIMVSAFDKTGLPTRLQPPRKHYPDLLTEMATAMDGLTPDELMTPGDEMTEEAVAIGSMDEDQRRAYTLYRQLDANRQEYGHWIPVEDLKEVARNVIYGSIDEQYGIHHKPMTLFLPDWTVAYSDKEPVNPLQELLGSGMMQIMTGDAPEGLTGQGLDDPDSDEDIDSWWDSEGTAEPIDLDELDIIDVDFEEDDGLTEFDDGPITDKITPLLPDEPDGDDEGDEDEPKDEDED